MTVVQRAPLRVELHLAYCAWLVLQPATLGRYAPPELPPWFQMFVDAAGADLEDLSGDWPDEVRERAHLVEEAVRRMTVAQLRATGGPGDVCRLLGCAPKAKRPAAWRRDLAIATGRESAA